MTRAGSKSGGFVCPGGSHARARTHTPPAAGLGLGPVPSVAAFSAVLTRLLHPLGAQECLTHSHLANTYKMTWQISGLRTREIILRTDLLCEWYPLLS